MSHNQCSNLESYVAWEPTNAYSMHKRGMSTMHVEACHDISTWHWSRARATTRSRTSATPHHKNQKKVLSSPLEGPERRVALCSHKKHRKVSVVRWTTVDDCCLNEKRGKQRFGALVEGCSCSCIASQGYGAKSRDFCGCGWREISSLVTLLTLHCFLPCFDNSRVRKETSIGLLL